MSRHLTRRQFSLTTLAAASALVPAIPLSAAPPSSSTPKVSSKPYPPLTVTPVPEAFESRYDDLGGVLDLTNGVIWGYEPHPALWSSNTGFQSATDVNDGYLEILAVLAATLPPETAPLAAAAYDVAVQRTWRWPTVFEARDAVAKGLFTFGEGGLNLYYKSPLDEVPDISYGVSVVRWTSSEVKPNLVHAFSPADGGTLLVSKTSSLSALVVSKL